MIRYLIMAVALAAGIVGFTLLNRQAPASAPASQPAVIDPQVQSKTPSQPGAAGPDRSVQVVSTGSELEAPVVEADPVMPTPEPWSELDNPPATPDRYQQKGVNARALKVNKSELAKVSAGDNIRLPIPQTGLAYDMKIEEVGRHQNGDRSLRGHLTDTDKPYAVIMTEGASATFATINTPEGSFMLEATGEAGWIMSLADLDYLIDPNLVDYQITDITR